MKVENARLMEMYEKWLSKEDGFTRATVRRNEYSKMMKAFSEAGLKRTNFRISIKQYDSGSSYQKAKAQWMKVWRKARFAQSCLE